jgi:hypothetical protein
MNTAAKQVIDEARLYAECGQPHAGVTLLRCAKSALPEDESLVREEARLSAPPGESRVRPWLVRCVDAMYTPALVAACAVTAVLLYGILFI